jgi:polyisoprenyl-phosphate glycosyltransferase
MPLYTIIIPCYYNEDNIPVTSKALIQNESLFPADVRFEYILVDDGSQDKTWAAMQDFHNQYPEKVKLVKLARNFGANSASLAGMEEATGDCVTVIAADMQDPPELLVQMYEHWQKGILLVVANRTNRADSFVGDLISNFFHYMMKKIAIPNTPKGGFDLCLFDKSVLQQLLSLDTRDVYWSYLLLWMGYPYVNIPYERRKREIGTSRWTFSKKVKSFIDNFVSFSFFPIRIISTTGIVLGLGAILYAMIIIISKLTGHIDETGWSSLMVVLLLVSSFQMVALGIIGEYVWRTLQSARQRPNYIVERKMLHDKDAQPPA